MAICSNCKADVPNPGRGPRGEIICCPHCVFNPLGCRCQYGEFGVAETFEDPDIPMFGPYDEEE